MPVIFGCSEPIPEFLELKCTICGNIHTYSYMSVEVEPV